MNIAVGSSKGEHISFDKEMEVMNQAGIKSQSKIMGQIFTARKAGREDGLL